MAERAQEALESAIDNLHEMKQMLGAVPLDSPQAFLEAAADVRHYLDRAVQDALAPELHSAAVLTEAPRAASTRPGDQQAVK